MNYKKIAIIAALESEVSVLKNALINRKDEILAGTPVFIGEIGDIEIILMQCGIGKVSAALGTQALITKYGPDCIINTGTAGGLSPELKIGDIVVAEKCAEWDLDYTSLGFPRGYISSLDTVFISTDKNLTQLLKKSIDGAVYSGLIVSGDQFVDNDSQRNIIFDSFPDALCTEMEGAAIAHVCAQNNTPCSIIRAISDTADHESGFNYTEFAEMAGEKSAAMLIDTLTKTI